MIYAEYQWGRIDDPCPSNGCWSAVRSQKDYTALSSDHPFGSACSTVIWVLAL